MTGDDWLTTAIRRGMGAEEPEPAPVTVRIEPKPYVPDEVDRMLSLLFAPIVPRPREPEPLRFEIVAVHPRRPEVVIGEALASFAGAEEAIRANRLAWERGTLTRVRRTSDGEWITEARGAKPAQEDEGES